MEDKADALHRDRLGKVCVSNSYGSITCIRFEGMISARVRGTPLTSCRKDNGNLRNQEFFGSYFGG